jgi:acyl-CoA synthetase (AMP-forming)/AMP-acid ligase II
VLIGGTTVLLPSGNFNASATLELMAAERITSMFLVPAQWQLLCADPSLPHRDLSALRTVSWGAAPATTTLLARMAEVFSGVTNVAVFGQTEMSPVTCALDGADALRKIGSGRRPDRPLQAAHHLARRGRAATQRQRQGPQDRAARPLRGSARRLMGEPGGGGRAAPSVRRTRPGAAGSGPKRPGGTCPPSQQA